MTISIAKWSRKAVVLTRVYRIQMSKTMSFEDAEGTVLIEDARTLPFKCPAVAQVSYEHPDVSNLNDIFADSTTNCQIPRHSSCRRSGQVDDGRKVGFGQKRRKGQLESGIIMNPAN